MLRWLLICGVLALAGSAQAADPPAAAAPPQRSEEPAYGPPADWVKPIPIPASGPAADGAPTQVVLYEVQSKLGPDGDAYFVDRVTKILAPEGLAAGGEVSKTWDPDTEDLTIHHVHVIRGGTVIDALAGGQKLLVLRRENKLELAMLDGRLTATIEPEGLQVGDIVDFSYTVRHHDAALKGHSEDYAALEHTGVAKQIYWREFWPASKSMRWRITDAVPTTPTITKTADGTEVVFDMRDVEAPKPPSGAPARFQELGTVEYSQYADWSQLSALLTPLWDKATTLAAGSPLRAEVAKIAAASSDPKARAAAALSLVEEQTRYVFLGMNDGGLVPADADASWSRRFGDCKGKTALLVALLRALGVTAEPALVSTTFGDGMDERLPMAAWFDHAIVRVEIGGKTYWLDGTRIGDRNLDDLTVPPFHWALPVRASGAALIKLEPVPLTQPGAALTITIDDSKGPDAPAPTHLEVLYHGEDAATLRQTLASVPHSDYDRYLREFWTKSDPWLDVQSVSATDDPVTGLPKLSADGAAKLDWSSAAGGQRFYRIPHSSMGADISFKRQPGPHQDAPYAVNYPLFVRQTVRIVLPTDGAFVLLGADIDKSVAGQALRRTSRIDKGVLTVDMTTQTTEPEFPASEAEADGAILRDMAKTIVAVAYRTGPPPPAAPRAQGSAAYLAAAQAGDAEAEFRLGQMYAQGQELPLDRPQAIAWFSKAAAQGHAGAETMLGEAYSRGDGVVQDYALALVWLRKAADRNDAQGEADLGYLYFGGKGVAVDQTQALKLFQKSAEQGNAVGEFGLASLFHFGRAVPKDDAQALVWTRKAAEQGLPRAEGQLAAAYQTGAGVAKDDAQSLLWANKAAALGDTAAMRLLGWDYQHGLAVTQDYAQAMTWYRKAADQGDVEANVSVAALYASGLGVPADTATAYDWIRKAADLGLPAAENLLGAAYASGNGLAHDDAEALVWFGKAAAQGDASAQIVLGVMYLHGNGVTKDEAKAVAFFRKAADQGNAVAEFNLGLAYASGTGVARDLVFAAGWYRKAADQGLPVAETALGEMYMTGAGVPRDQAQAQIWLQKSAGPAPIKPVPNPRFLAGAGSLAPLKIAPVAVPQASTTSGADVGDSPALTSTPRN